MANNLKHPSPSSSAGEKEMEYLHTIFSSEEDEPEDPPPRSASTKDVCGFSESQMSGRKRLSTNVSSKRAKKIYTQGGKMGTKTPSHRRLFSEKDEIVLLEGIIDFKGKNPLEAKRSFYQSIKGSLSLSFDVTLKQLEDKIRYMKKLYTAKAKSGEQASVLNPHQQKCFQLSKAIWGAEGVASDSPIISNSKSKESERRTTEKIDLVTSPKGKNVQEVRRRRDMEKSPSVVTETDCDESSFFLGMDFLKEKWTKVPTETKKKTQEKMKKLLADELECQKFEEMLKAMKDKCAQEKVELLNEVTSLIMAAD
ncbi:unnamed protein product [Eruca vesicaria subsp. sativa]|uniref:Glabrous enhancer-binding protein-like DBD domain-containing protein n=1 Tax=Eruca vesicaria subsp. sativa TaxID=29727 RepID=A0ABC8L7H4_ERUVS|nr:unnamed protein product [Eruca vesicaria subsp. sativa]